MQLSFSLLKKVDWILIVAVILLSLISILTIYSSITNKDLAISYAKKQSVFLLIGLAAFIFLTLFDYRIFKNRSFVILIFYTLSIFLLVLTLVLEKRVRGAASWLDFGYFKFEPIELAKFALLLVLAKYFSGRHIEIYSFSPILISGLYAGLPALLVLFQPDLGAVLLLMILWIFVMIASGIKLSHLLFLFVISFLLIGIFWLFILLPYQKSRIISFFNPQKDPFGSGYNLIQSLIAIGGGGVWGKGLGRGTQVQLGFLPEAHTDFIFSSFAEEWGLLGIIFLFLLYFIIIWRLTRIITKSKNNFSLLFIFGFLILLTSQFFINIGMNIGLLPITGISLPLFSYGGSGLLLFFSLLGISQSIHLRT